MMDQKYKELIKYICAKLQDDPYLGKTKLCKILFFCDFFAYRELNSLLTGDSYIKQPYGPVPTHIKTVLRDLIAAGAIAMSVGIVGGREIQKCVTTSHCNVDVFSAREVSIIDSIISQVREKKARFLSDLSHHFIGWRMVDLGQNIPFGTALLHNSSEDNNDIEFSQEYTNTLLDEAEIEFASHI